MKEVNMSVDTLNQLIEAAENSKLISRAGSTQKREAVTLEVRSQLRSDLKTLRGLIPPDRLPQIFEFFCYLRTQSVSPVSGAREIAKYFSDAIKGNFPITIVTWDCPGCAAPYIKNGEITKDPLDSPEGARNTLYRRRFISRSELALPLLKLISQLKEILPIDFLLITAGLNAQTYYPKSTETDTQKQSAIRAVSLFTSEYQKWADNTFGPLSFPITVDLDLYPLSPDSNYWEIYQKILNGQIPIPDFVFKKQMEINKRITEPLGLSASPEAKSLATRVIAAYGAEGVILDELKPKLGNIIVAATEAISVFYQRQNFARQFLGLKPLPTFYTLYD